MRNQHSALIRAGCAIALSCALTGLASAQTFPSRPLRVVVGLAPGGGICQLDVDSVTI